MTGDMGQVLDNGIAVVAGGLSTEREVSLRSAERIVAVLDESGLPADLVDAEPDVLTQVLHRRPSVVWPTLHGSSGEDGSLAEILRLVGCPVVGTGPGGCRLAWDKSVASELARLASVSVPEAVTVTAQQFRDIGAHRLVAAVVGTLDLPVVVKPKRGGSGLGITLVDRVADLPEAVVGALGYDSSCRIERCVHGREVTVTVVAEERGPWACPPVELEPIGGGDYDFGARYTAGATEFRVPADFGESEAERLGQGSLLVHERLGLGSISRCDWIVDDTGVCWFLEVNTSPGMTETSTAPLGMAASGQLSELFRRLVEAARPLR